MGNISTVDYRLLDLRLYMDNYTVTSEIYAESNNVTDIKATIDTKNVVSVFKFIRLKTSTLATTDSDGDLVVRRKTKESYNEMVEIEHCTSTTLNLVGLQIWRGAFLLADWLIYNNEKLPEDAIILELGSGVGLTSIVAAMYRKVVCTDINHGNILKLIESNVNRNKSLINHTVNIFELNFLSKSFNEDIEKVLSHVSTVIAADVIYDDKITDGFVNTVRMLFIKNPNISIYISLEKRYVFTIGEFDTCAPCYEYFLEQLQKLPNVKLELEDLSFPLYFQYDRIKELVLWKVTSVL